jgi:RNA polymerase sigma factor (sigma-70 family)
MSDAATLTAGLAPDVAAAARGDHRAFARLVDATRGTVSSIALAILRDVEMSREVAQDVYLAAWSDLRRLRDPASFLPWIRQLTRNRAHHVLRGQVRRRRRLAEGGPDALLAAAADPRPGALDALVAEEERVRLAAMIDALPPSTREVVVLYYREGRSARQVAGLLGIGEDAVKQRLSRSRARLRAALAERLEGTAPTAAFTAAVMTALSVAALGAAAAATLGAGKAAAGTQAASKLGGAALLSSGVFAGAVLGLAGGWGGVLFGSRHLLRLARDDEERRGIVHFTLVCLAVPLLFLAVMLLRPRPLPVTLSFLGVLAAYWVVHFVWLPRITRRRYEAEILEDPVWAAREHRKRRRLMIGGFVGGAVLGGLPVLATWFR